MTLLDVLTVALIRGLGEALPVGAAGPLVALPGLAGTTNGRLALAIATDLGVLTALVLYFWRDVLAMLTGLWRLAKGKPDSGTRLMAYVVLGTVPAMTAGLALGAATPVIAVGPLTAAALILGGGIVLLVCDRLGVTVRRIEHLTPVMALGIGLLQIAALVPGVSRTGITIATARLLGWERREAARFSLLLAMPLLFGHGLANLWTLSRHTQPILSADLQIAAAASATIALVAVAAMMAWVGRNGYTILAILAMGLGVVTALLAIW